VDAVVKIGIVREHVHPNPFYWLVFFVAVPDWGKYLSLCFNYSVAIHACAGWGYCGMCSSFYSIVTVAAVHAELTCVYLMTKRHGLLWSITHICIFWRTPVTERKNH